MRRWSFFDKLRDLDIKVGDTSEIAVQNIVASADFGRPLNLDAIAFGHGLAIVEYEPEQFPGLAYRLDDLSVVVLLFGPRRSSSPAAESRAMDRRVHYRWVASQSSALTSA